MDVSDSEKTFKKKRKRRHESINRSGDFLEDADVPREQPKEKKQKKAPSEQGLPGDASLPMTQAQDLPAEKPVITEKDGKGTGKLSAEGKNQPVLPWMRLPIKIEAGQGVQLADVRGLDHRLQDALRTCEYPMLGSPFSCFGWAPLNTLCFTVIRAPCFGWPGLN